MGYFEIILNMVIAFRVKVSYHFAISTQNGLQNYLWAL
jgi:hypothetical protein